MGGSLTVARYYVLRGASALAGESRYCPVCEWTGRSFRPMMLLEAGYVRANVVCPRCGSWERQRALAPVLRDILASGDISGRADALHVSPEGCLEQIIRRASRRYRASNYVDPQPGQLRLDLQDLALPDEDLDLVVMSYVLCCVRDDRLAIAALWRVLRPGGLIVACEPLGEGLPTHELTTPGHGGMWRRYGERDVHDRFRPFALEVRSLTASLTTAERRRRGLQTPEYAFLLRKPM